ncbi:hypothetical protein PCNPT3_04390 [Psychromonas sp. CNPT3]|uniref:DUF2987 domain-containing protein n=1 Tax=Psychromonas sp. CNPT3 TaxID=314282 RepID=UPI00006E808B|nr:DUF2987 domain-containing protein [Psychromonas sp. CNPT3]AGH80820.1 hypothetical protein PCNPT3_04390 [Psychromonas sp. CNPT3]
MRALVILVMIFSVSNAFAAPLKLNYSLFFGYMKTTFKLDHKFVSTVFYLRDVEHATNCQIQKAEMVVDNKHKAIGFTQDGQLMPFFSDQWRKDGAMIEVTLKEAQQCALVVQTMAKTEALQDLDYARLKDIRSQLESTYKKNAGMIGKYFVPEFLGVRLQLGSVLSASERQRLSAQMQLAEDGALLMSNASIEIVDATTPINLNIVGILPWIAH